MYLNSSIPPMRQGLAALLLVAATCAGAQAAQIPQIVGPGGCRACHQQLDEARLTSPTLQLDYDRHARIGMGCADCHGGDSQAIEATAAHNAAAGYIGIPEPARIVELCARCHADPAFMVQHNPGLPTDQLEKYGTSMHGKLLAMGLRKVANCASCHSAHNVRTASDPLSSTYPVHLPRTCAQCHSSTQHMAGFPIPTDQFAKYAVSVHGRALLEKEDLGAPACNDCHSNHGAVPPGAQSVAHVCGTCHALNAEYYEKSPHAEIWKIQERGQCTTCHQHHAIAAPEHTAFAMGPDSMCIQCHHPDDAGWAAGRSMYATLEELVELQTEATTRLTTAHNLGMDVSDGDFIMQDFRKSVMQLRTLSHQLDVQGFTKAATAARDQVAGARQIAESAISEFHYRRRGLMIALLLSLPVFALMRLKILSSGSVRRNPNEPG